MTNPLDNYAVMGNPIAHSLSPQIHHYFASQLQQPMNYEKIRVEDIEQAINQFFAAGGKGLNITIPFKELAFKLATVTTERCQKAQAANTLWMNEQQQLCADNTDGIGLVRAITQITPIQGKRILLIGAGGAARGVIAPLLAQEPKQLKLINRTLDKAKKLADEFLIEAGDFAEPIIDCDILINATSASLNDEVPPLNIPTLKKSCLVYDMVYQANPTVFMQWGRQLGAEQTLDGLTMLIEQAAEAFSIWRGVTPGNAIKNNLLKKLRKTV